MICEMSHCDECNYLSSVVSRFPAKTICSDCMAKPTPDQIRINELEACLAEAVAELERVSVLRPAIEWHEDTGNVLWWSLPIKEPPYCGTPLDIDFDPNYHTHFSGLPKMSIPWQE